MALAKRVDIGKPTSGSFSTASVITKKTTSPTIAVRVDPIKQIIPETSKTIRVQKRVIATKKDDIPIALTPQQTEQKRRDEIVRKKKEDYENNPFIKASKNIPYSGEAGEVYSTYLLSEYEKHKGETDLGVLRASANYAKFKADIVAKKKLNELQIASTIQERTDYVNLARERGVSVNPGYLKHFDRRLTHLIGGTGGSTKRIQNIKDKSLRADINKAGKAKVDKMRLERGSPVFRSKPIKLRSGKAYIPRYIEDTGQLVSFGNSKGYAGSVSDPFKREANILAGFDRESRLYSQAGYDKYYSGKATQKALENVQYSTVPLSLKRISTPKIPRRPIGLPLGSFETPTFPMPTPTRAKRLGPQSPGRLFNVATPIDLQQKQSTPTRANRIDKTASSFFTKDISSLI